MDQTITILYVIHNSDMYGATLSSLDLIVGLKRKYGIKPIVLIPTKGKIEDVLQKEGITYEIKYFPWWVSSVKLKFTDLIKFFFYNLYNYYKLIYKSIKKYQINYVYSNSAAINVGLILAKLLKVKHIWHLREFLQEDFGFNYYYPKWFVKLFFHHSDICISVSNAVKTKYLRSFPQINIINIYNGITNNRPKREIHIDNSNVVNFCCVGFISSPKNQLDILKAFNIVKNHTMNFQLYLIGGGDNGYIDMLKDFATTNDLLNQIHFLGYRNDINDILQDMHVGIMASRCEAFGRVTVEYMNASIPVIATDSGGSPEIVHDNISGFIYKQGDYEDLAKIIEHIIASPNIITTLGCNGYDIAHMDFTLDKHIDNMYSLIKNMQNNE